MSYDYGDAYDDVDDAYEGDEVAEEENSWQNQCAETCAISKPLMTSNPAECEQGYLSVIDMDQEHGAFTYKAKKMLARLYQLSSQWNKLEAAYRDMVLFQFDDKTAAMNEKAIRKFFLRSAKVPNRIMAKIYQATLDLVKEGGGYDGIRFTAKRGLVDITLKQRKVDDNTDKESPVTPAEFASAEQQLQELEDLCLAGNVDRKAGQLYEVYTHFINLYQACGNTEKEEEYYGLAQFYRASRPDHEAIVKECAGRLALRGKNYQEASTRFLEAFKLFDASGARARATACLKYLVVATLIVQLQASSSSFTSNSSSSEDGTTGGGTTVAHQRIDPTLSAEAKTYRPSPEVLPAAMLMAAFHADDTARLEALIVANDDVRRTLVDDPVTAPCLNALLHDVKVAQLQEACVGYRTLRLDYLAQQLGVALSSSNNTASSSTRGEDANGLTAGSGSINHLVTSAILSGKVNASIDSVNGLVLLSDDTEIDKSRTVMLQRRWAPAFRSMMASVGQSSAFGSSGAGGGSGASSGVGNAGSIIDEYYDD